ncbi:hypothetical protein Bbelb_317240 [Branchiostoma belcheri]|nr:hypothetical protein Bbelb_317240 [Branchiostoma belcheri]
MEETGTRVEHLGFANDGEGVPEAQRRTAAQKAASLELMLGQVANFCPVITRNRIVKASTSLSDIWQAIRLHFGFQATGGFFLEIANIKQEPNERPEDLYQRLTTAELTAVLAQVEGADDLLTDATGQSKVAADDQSLYINSGAPEKGEKPLLIPEFVDSFSQPESDHEVARDGNTSIILRTSRSRPKVETINIPAWSAANAKIMAKLIQSNKLATKQDVEDYLAYTIKVSKLLEVFDVPSVMLYDNQYRILQNRHGFRWGSDSEHLHSRFLRTRMAQPQ